MRRIVKLCCAVLALPLMTPGQPYDVFVGERILKPLGMQDTHFFLPPGKRPRLAAFYRRENGRLVATQMDLPHEGRVFPAPGWGLYSTASDLGKLLQMMLNGGTHDGQRLLSQASVEVMTTDQIPHLTPQSQPMSAGLAWGVARRPGAVGPLTSSAAYRTIASSGSVVWVDPDQELIGVLLTHQPVDVSMFMTVIAMASAAIVE